MKLRFWREQRPRRPAAAIMAGLMAVSLLPASALTARAEEPDPDIAQVAASAEVQTDPFDFERESDAGKLDKEAKSSRPALTFGTATPTATAFMRTTSPR